MSCKIYIAAQYRRREEMKLHARQLEKKGFTITASWLNEDFDPSIKLDDVPRGTRQDLALQDLGDIDRSDVLLFFSEPQDRQPPRGGRHCEFGYALGKMRRIVVVGSEENLFHYLPKQIVAVVPTLEHAIALLKTESLMQREPELWGV